MKARKRPIIIDAIKWDGTLETLQEIQVLNKLNMNLKIKGFTDALAITTLEGIVYCPKGAYVICGVHGELYPCQAEIFEQTYDVIED